MVVRLLGTLLLVWLIAAPGSAGDKKDDFGGTWVLESVEINGQKKSADDVKGIVAVVEKDTVVIKKNDQVVKKATFTYDSKKTPMTMDITILTSAGAKQTILQIYKLEGDVLTICGGGKDGKNRPTEFTAKEGSDQELLVYRRKK